MATALPKTDPFEEPLKAENGDAAAVKPEMDEFAKESAGFVEGTVSDLPSSPGVDCEGPGLGALLVASEVCQGCQ